MQQQWKARRFLILLSMILMVGCQTTDHKFYPYELNIKEFQKVTQYKKILILPTQLFTVTKEKDRHLYNEIDLSTKSYLEKKGYTVTISSQIESIWEKHKLQASGFYDQGTGKINYFLFEETIHNAIAELTNLNEFSAIIMPKVIFHHLNLSKKSPDKGAWDGVARKVVSSFGSKNGWSRHTAMSLEITALSNKLSSIFKSRGGIDFITKNIRKKNTYSQSQKKQTEISKEDISEAIEIGFYPFINSARIEKTLPNSYKNMLRRKIYMFLEYPESAREKEMEGRVIVRFKVTPSGTAKDIEIIRSSNHTILDTQAIDSISLAEPFPPPPTPFFKGDVTIQFPLVFKQ